MIVDQDKGVCVNSRKWITQASFYFAGKIDCIGWIYEMEKRLEARI